MMSVQKKILKQMQERIVRSFLDVIILAQLRKEPKGAYSIITLIYKKFHFLMSPGTIYSTMYMLERDGSIEGNWAQRKRVYKLTDKGKETIKVILDTNEKIQLFVANLFSDSSE